MKKTRRAYLSALGVGAVAGCVGRSADAGGGGDAATASPTATPTATASGPDPSVESASLLLNWKPNGLHVPYYTAAARGYYEAEGLPLSAIKAGKGSDFAAKQAGLGNVSFAITSSDQVVNINSRGLSPRSVGVVMQKSPVVVFATRESLGAKLTSVEQLAGKRVGTGPGMVRILTELLLKRRGVLADVELVDTGYSTVQKLLAGDVAAAGGVFGDAIAARAQGYTVDSIPVAETIPSYGHVVATGADFADAHPDAVRAFLRATARGAAWAQRHPESAVGHLIEANGTLAESRTQQRRKWETMASRFMLSAAVRERGWGWSRPEPWRVTADALADAGLLGGEVDPGAVWTNAYLDTDYRYIGAYSDVVSG